MTKKTKYYWEPVDGWEERRPYDKCPHCQKFKLTMNRGFEHEGGFLQEYSTEYTDYGFQCLNCKYRCEND